MANIKSFPNNQDEYIGAEYVMKWLHGRTSGVFAAENNAAVAAVQNAMAVTVADGLGWMANNEADGIVWWNDVEKTNGAKLQLNVDAADTSLNRIDRVIVEWKTTNYVDVPEIKILKGTMSSTATAPELTNNSTLRQISLARIDILAGTTELTNANITDERLDPSVCGLVTDSISIDTSMIHAQVESVLTETQDQAAAVLTAIANELAALEAGTAVELKHLEFHNIEVPVDGWAEYTASGDEESALYEAGYTYRIAVALLGAISTMSPDITPSISVDDCGATVWRAAQSYNGGIYLYADGAPDAPFTLLTVNLWKVGETNA